MSDKFLGEIRMVAFNYPPKGWAFCNGQLMAIAQNQALFALLGTTYGGDGIRTFALPNLQGRVPIHMSSNYPIGGAAGEPAHTLVQNEIPTHTHAINGSSNSANTGSPANDFWPSNSSTGLPYAPASDNSLMANQTIASTGGQPHENMPPYLVVNFAIALVGIFPSRD